MAQSEGPVVCGIPSVKALPKEVAGDGRLCCCGREKEHPAEVAASIPAGQCGDKKRVLPRHSGKSSVRATAECLDGWQQGPFLSGSGLGGFQKSILVLSSNYRQTPALKCFKSVLARMSLGRKSCKASLNR